MYPNFGDAVLSLVTIGACGGGQVNRVGGFYLEFALRWQLWLLSGEYQ